MTNRQAAVIASRVLCFWFIYEAVAELMYLPGLMDLWEAHSRLSATLTRLNSHAPAMAQGLFWPTLEPLIHIVLNVALAIFFYRSSSGLIRFLTASEADAEPAESGAVL